MMTVKRINVLRAHIVTANGRGVAHQPKHEVNGAMAISIRITLTPHVKRRLGIPQDTHAYATLIIEPLQANSLATSAVDMIADQLLSGNDTIYTPKRG